MYSLVMKLYVCMWAFDAQIEQQQEQHKKNDNHNRVNTFIYQYNTYIYINLLYFETLWFCNNNKQ